MKLLIARLKHWSLGHKWKPITRSACCDTIHISACDRCDLVEYFHFYAMGEHFKLFELDATVKNRPFVDTTEEDFKR